MFLILGGIAAAVLIGVITGLVIYARWHYGFLEKLGIPVEPPSFMLGSCPDIYKTNPQLEDIKLFKKHGPVFGLYEGRNPQIMIADPELVKLIMVRDYEHFSSRSNIDLGHAIANEILDYLPDGRWKHVRSMMTPALTSSKMKQFSVVVNEIAEEFVAKLSEECVNDKMEIDFRNRAIAPLLDIGATGLYGMEIENRKDPNNVTLELMKSIMCEDVKYDWKYTLMMVFPFLKTMFPSWPFPLHDIDSMKRIILGYLKQRRAQNIVSNDLGDVFVKMINNLNTPEYRKLGITANTAIAQVIEVFFTVYDSVGTAMTMFVYFMSLNADIQDKVLEEIDTVWDKYDGDITYEAANDLVYMTACLNEAMRLNPSFMRPERKCTKDWIGYLEGGIVLRIPKGANVVIPIYALHRHPDYFPDPETYNPERFMPGYQPKLHNYAFTAFGHGPKKCIGQKVAYCTMKIMLCRIMKDFMFRPTERTRLQFKKGTLFVTQYAPMYFELVRR